MTLREVTAHYTFTDMRCEDREERGRKGINAVGDSTRLSSECAVPEQLSGPWGVNTALGVGSAGETKTSPSLARKTAVRNH